MIDNELENKKKLDKYIKRVFYMIKINNNKSIKK